MNDLIDKNNERIFITGGNQLSGTVNVSGAKNAALPLMALSLLISKGFTLSNVPNLADTRLMLQLLNELGIKSKWKDGVIDFDGSPKQKKLHMNL